MFKLFIGTTMFRSLCSRVAHVGCVSSPLNSKIASVSSIRMSSHSTETDEEFDARYVAYFSRPEIDQWEARKAMNDLAGLDLVPEPKIIIAALHASRRLNDYSMAVRFLEMVREKCGSKKNEIYPYILQEITPTLQELGINTPGEMGYDEPELALQSVYDL